MIEIFRDQDEAYGRWLAGNPEHFVLNVEKGTKYHRLHRASCSSLDPENANNKRLGSLTSGGNIKVGADSVAALVEWLAENKPGIQYKSCGYRSCALNFDSATVPSKGSGMWWVNHKQTHKAEIDGEYIWSPKRKADGGRNQTYENLRLVQPGDTVFSYANGAVRAIGTAMARHVDSPKPVEFGASGESWGDDGWMIPVRWQLLSVPFEPKRHLDKLIEFLPAKHSPLQSNGNGNQGCYLAAVSQDLADVVLSFAALSDASAIDLAMEAAADLVEELEVNKIMLSELPSTQKQRLIEARVGQGKFRKNVLIMTSSCRLTGVTAESFLVASHIKPWNVSSNRERLDGANGIALSPHVDKLFDRGWISFSDDGRMLVANATAESTLKAWGLPTWHKGQAFQARQWEYLEYHRTNVFGVHRL